MKLIEHGLASLVIVAGMSLMGCGGDETDGDGAGGTPAAGGMAAGGSGGVDAPTTTDVFNRLAPSCGPCHAPTAAANTAYFASEEAFQTLVVDEHVVPGDPDASSLVQLLEGTAMGGTFTQMPLSVKFVDMPDTQISIGEIRAWISAL